MNELKMPKKGESARMLAELQAEHASESPPAEVIAADVATHVTTLQATPEPTGARASAGTNEPALEATGVRTHAPTNEHATGTQADSNQNLADGSTIDHTEPAQGRRKRPTERDERLALALRRGADDEIAVVTVRVPAALNRYMDDYTTRINRVDPKRKYRKQDAVLEAFAAFYADHPMPPAPEEETL